MSAGPYRSRGMNAAYRKGHVAAGAGVAIGDNPYRQRLRGREPRRGSWSEAWSRAWALGWQEATQRAARASAPAAPAVAEG